jgi:putative acetyltransferase
VARWNSNVPVPLIVAPLPAAPAMLVRPTRSSFSDTPVSKSITSDLPVVTDDQTIAAVALGPMSVVPAYQRRGVGSALVRAGLEACRQRGYRVAIVLGHRAFYPRFGFSSALARQIDAPYSGEDFMAVELEPGAMARLRGRVTYPPPFGEV